jgi:hypothetical protein
VLYFTAAMTTDEPGHNTIWRVQLRQNVGYNASTALNASPDSNKTAFPDLLNNPFPMINQPIGNSQGLMTFVGNSFNS